MRKFFTCSMMVLSVLAFGQDEESNKPIKKNISLELNLNPFTTNPINITYFRARLFIKDRQALRLGFIAGGRKEQSGNDQLGKTFSFSIRPGFEYHLKGTKQLSPYLGAEIEYGYKNSSFASTQSGNSFTLDGTINSNGEEQGYNRYSANLLVGLDFYPIKRLYVGTELGFGYASTDFTDIILNQGNTNTTFRGGTYSQYGPVINRTIRFGFIF